MKALAQLKMGMAICCLLAAAGCAQKKDLESVEKVPDFAVSGIAVLPVRPVADMDENLSPADEKILQDGSGVMTGLLKEVLTGKAGVRFVSLGQAKVMEGTGHTLETARRIAAQQNSNAVLETTLSRYVERVGSEYGVKQPAAVTFAYKLYEVKEGRVLCHGRFDEQQQSLMENLLNLPKTQSRGLVWLTAEELARDGLKEKFAQCPYLEGK
ncbi:hypothetical protein [Desulfobulbus sp.]|uniref:hypothetical protein n=1 Tax=Desulfobulbus sp. TaxID=895 RepID=UPI00286F1202|nr:hypothetical protein [Desulfobulbus sp.]